MKIAFVSQPRDGIGENTSLGIINLALARSIAESCDVIVYGKRNPSVSEPVYNLKRLTYKYISVALDDYIIKPGLKILRLLGFGRKKKLPNYASLLYYAGYASLIAMHIRKEKCQAVHIHNYSQFVPVIRAINPDIRIILHMNCEWLTQMDKRTIEGRLKKTDIILGCSDYISGKIKKQFPLLSGRVYTLYNGVDTKKFTPKTPGPVSGKKTKILFIGRVSPEKGVHILVEAFSSIAGKHSDAELHIIGPHGASSFIIELDDDEIVKNLAHFYYGGDYPAYVKNSIKPGLEKRIIFHGAVEHSRLVDFYHESDIFTFPSVWNEPFGIPVVEAMSCGKPVVAAKSGGITEIINNGVNGFLVERNNAEELAEALDNLLSDSALRAGIGQAGRQRAEELFSWDHLASRLLNFYKPLQQENSSSSPVLISSKE